MKNNKTILIIFLLLFFQTALLNLNAQITSKKVDVKWGTLIDAKKTTLDDVLGVSEGNLYTLNFERKGLFSFRYTVDKYDSNLKFLKSALLELKQEKNDMNLAFSVMSKNEDIFLFSTYQNTKNKVKYLFSQTLNKSTLKPNNDLKKVAEIDYKDFSKYNPGNF